MAIKIFDTASDEVIDSTVATGKTTYQYAIDNLFPLIDRFSAQRKLQDKKFYSRLERDILKNCLMPPITIAFVEPEFFTSSKNGSGSSIEQYIEANIRDGYILDGIQRLNTLKSASENPEFNNSQPLYINVIISPSTDKLLYRMITLNNGQKPMTPRHQIEILTQEMFKFSLSNINVQTEKQRAEMPIPGSFDLGDISKAYLAFLTGTVNNDNNKIINEKMDQIIVGRIMDQEPNSDGIDFMTVINEIDRLSIHTVAHKWLGTTNNLIGFSVGIKTSYEFIKNMSPEEFAETLELFEEAFKAINPSKVNLGKFRRELSYKFIEYLPKYYDADEMELIEYFAELTA